jgi:Uma2 family endonuclease
MSRALSGEPQAFTLQEYEQLPSQDGFRDELVRGRLVRAPQPGEAHAAVQARLCVILVDHVDRYDLGVVLGPAGFVLQQEPPTVRGPDLSFLTRAGMGPGWPQRRFRHGAPDLAVEIVSPGNRTSELTAKVIDYFRAGCRQVWVVDPATRTVAIWRSAADVRVLHGGDELEGGDLLPGLRVPLVRVFGC